MMVTIDTYFDHRAAFMYAPWLRDSISVDFEYIIKFLEDTLLGGPQLNAACAITSYYRGSEIRCYYIGEFPEDGQLESLSYFKHHADMYITISYTPIDYTNDLFKSSMRWVKKFSINKGLKIVAVAEDEHGEPLFIPIYKDSESSFHGYVDYERRLSLWSASFEPNTITKKLDKVKVQIPRTPLVIWKQERLFKDYIQSLISYLSTLQPDEIKFYAKVVKTLFDQSYMKTLEKLLQRAMTEEILLLYNFLREGA